MKTIEIGRLGERAAIKYLKRQKYKIIAANIHVSHNEIDIVAKNKEFIVFVEVKSRSTDTDLFNNFGSPASAVTYGKRQRTIEAARGFLKDGKYSRLQPRFDVIEIYLHKDTAKLLYINHIINAFSA